MYRFIRILNHNAVLAKDSCGQEVILLGKGIGFRHGKEDHSTVISKSDVEKTFIPLSNQLAHAYLDLIHRIDASILSACSEIVLKARESLGELQPNIFVVLSVHIDFAIKRIRENISIENPLMEEIEILYPKEYAVALEGKKILEKHLQMSICDEEAGYIALHLNAARYNQDVKDPLRHTNLIRNLVDKTQQLMGIKLKKDHSYRQLIDHFRGVIERLQNNILTPNPLLNETKAKLAYEYQIAEQLATILEQDTSKKLSDSEIAYIAAHLYRLKMTAL